MDIFRENRSDGQATEGENKDVRERLSEENMGLKR